jgi:O-antigen/teichoic acid export membrane protein
MRQMPATIEHPQEPASSAGPRRSINTKGRTLRAFAARGVLINTSFDIGLSLLTLLRGFILAAVLTRADFGIWGILAASLGVLARLKLVGIGDKYIQQEEEDQEHAFQKAFTLELLVTAITVVPLMLALPLIAVVYGHWEVVAPGAVLLSAMLAYALQSPFWIWYRNMDFFRQRMLGLVEPVVGFVVAIALALLGAGYWSLVIGLTAGAWAGAVVAMTRSPYRLRWRFDRQSMRIYIAFSWPVFVASACSVVLANSAALVANAHLGLAAVGSIALASNITQFTTKVDDLVGDTLYPAICAIQDRIDLLRESFVKTNRLALMWAMPFGAGVALFAADLVHFALGEKWHSSIILLQAMGVASAVAHVGWNWDDYLRARSNTKPMALAGVVTTATFLACLPLVVAFGLPGLAAAIGAQALVALIFRAVYMTRLFAGFRVVRHALRAILPTLPATALVLITRQVTGGSDTAAMAVAELCLYVGVTIAATWAIEGRLVREALGYIFERASQPVAAPS